MYLFEPYKLKNLTLSNRVVMPAMCQYSADENGQVNQWHKTHYGARAVGGVGLIILEATAVEKRGRLSNHDLGIYQDRHVAGLAELVELCHSFGSKVGIQIAHGGRKSFGENTVAPSNIPFSDDYAQPKPLDKQEIKKVIKEWGKAAKRSAEAGFDVLQIHGAHGYLIHQFLSPLANDRQDEYGGDLRNRMRFLLEVLREVKANWPSERVLSVRLSASDCLVGGITLEDTVKISRILRSEGVDIIDVSLGGLLPASMDIGPGYQIRYAETVKHEADIPTIAVGLITQVELAEEIVRNKRADLVALGRELLRNPYWVLQEGENNPKVAWPEQYHRARRAD